MGLIANKMVPGRDNIPCGPTVTMSYTYTPLQFEQLHLSYVSVILSTLSFLRFSEVVVFLVCWWNSCQYIEKSYQWVSMVSEDVLPTLEFMAERDDITRAQIENLRLITQRYALSLDTERFGANVLLRCLKVLQLLRMRDKQKGSFFPWKTWRGRKALVAEAKAEVTKVEDAISVSMNMLV